MATTTAPNPIGPTAFLPRLQPVHLGAFPRGPFVHRWWGRVMGVDVMVSSTRPVAGVSRHLVSDRLGHWLEYSHQLSNGARRLVACSARGPARFGAAFGVRAPKRNGVA